MLPETITKVTEKFMQFPALGRRSSQKIALQILEQSDTEFNELVENMQEMKKSVTFCPICSFFSQDNQPCNICQDKSRTDLQLCVVEKGTETIAMEKSLAYRGKYHILGRLISPLDNIFAPNTNIPNLIHRIQSTVDRIRQGELSDLRSTAGLELIIFLQPSFNAEATMAYIREKIKELDLEEVKITKMAQGLPSFYNVDTLDQETLARSMEGRIPIL